MPSFAVRASSSEWVLIGFIPAAELLLADLQNAGEACQKLSRSLPQQLQTGTLDETPDSPDIDLRIFADKLN